MQPATAISSLSSSTLPALRQQTNPTRETIRSWLPMRAQLLLQWKKLTALELDEAGPNRRRIAQLIGRKYAIATELVESYLRGFERTLVLSKPSIPHR